MAKLRILGKTYSLETVPDENLESFGDCDPQQQRIRISRALHRDRHAEVVLHEVLHALWEAQDLPEDEALEERVVTSLAKGLAAVFLDNGERLPTFMRQST